MIGWAADNSIENTKKSMLDGFKIMPDARVIVEKHAHTTDASFFFLSYSSGCRWMWGSIEVVMPTTPLTNNETRGPGH